MASLVEVREAISKENFIKPIAACGLKIDRDYNASLNLYALIEKQLGQVLPEVTPEDLTALQCDLAINLIATSKVDTGIQQKSYL